MSGASYSAEDLSSALNQCRFEIGDTDTAAALFTDAEINHKLQTVRAGNVLLAAADLCDVLSTRYANLASTSVGGQSIQLGELSANYAARGDALRGRASGGTGLVSIGVTKRDGYSSTISSRDVNRQNGVASQDRPLWTGWT